MNYQWWKYKLPSIVCERIDYFQEYAFRLVENDKVRVDRHDRDDGSCISTDLLDLDKFVTYYNDPFWIKTPDILILNRRYGYGYSLIEWMQGHQFPGFNPERLLMPMLDHELPKFGIPENCEQANSFRDGLPILFVSGLSLRGRRGKKAHSATAESLRRAIYSWTCLSEAVIRNSLEHHSSLNTNPIRTQNVTISWRAC